MSLSYCSHPTQNQLILKVMMKGYGVTQSPLLCERYPGKAKHNLTVKPARLAGTCIRCLSPLCSYDTSQQPVTPSFNNLLDQVISRTSCGLPDSEKYHFRWHVGLPIGMCIKTWRSTERFHTNKILLTNDQILK